MLTCIKGVETQCLTVPCSPDIMDNARKQYELIMDNARKQYELAMDNARKQYELDEPVKPDLKLYYKEYHLWVKDFEKTDEYKKMVADYEMDWIKLYTEEFHRIFEHDVWLERHGYWLTKQYLMDRENKRIIYHDSYTHEIDEGLSYYKK